MCTSFLFSLDFHGFISIYMVLFLLTENLFLSWVYLWLFVFFILTSSTVLISQFAHGVYRSVCQWHAEIVCTYQSLPMLLMLPKLSPSQTFCCAPKLACVVTACVSQSAQSESNIFLFLWTETVNGVSGSILSESLCCAPLQTTPKTVIVCVCRPSKWRTWPEPYPVSPLSPVHTPKSRSSAPSSSESLHLCCCIASSLWPSHQICLIAFGYTRGELLLFSLFCVYFSFFVLCF